MNLDATNKSVTVVLGEAHTTNPVDLTAAWEDLTTTTFIAGATDTATNGTTPVTLIASPAASTQRRIKEMTVYNNDTVSHVTTVKYLDGASARVLWKGTLAVGQLLQWRNGSWDTVSRQTLLSTDISDSTVAGRAVITGADITTIRQGLAAAPFDALAFNGMQINGSMDVSQLNGSTSVVGAASQIHPVDGWIMNKSGTMVINTQQVSDAPPGYQSSVKITVTTAEASLGSSDNVFLYQPIEGYRFARCNFGAAGASSVSIGFWIKAHRTGAYSGSVKNSAGNRSYPFSFTINSADTWEFKTVTITGDTTGTWLTTNGVGIFIIITMAAGSAIVGTANAWSASSLNGVTGTTNGVAATSDTFQLTGVIVLPGIEVPGSDRAPFIMRPFDIELVLCKRHWQKSYVYGTAPGTGGQPVGFRNATNATGVTAINTRSFILSNSLEVEMRAVPSLTVYDPNASSANGKISGYSSATQYTVSSIVPSTKTIGALIITTVAPTVDEPTILHFVADAQN